VDTGGRVEAHHRNTSSKAGGMMRCWLIQSMPAGLTMPASTPGPQITFFDTGRHRRGFGGIERATAEAPKRRKVRA
jgi:hypothetical protein